MLIDRLTLAYLFIFVCVLSVGFLAFKWRQSERIRRQTMRGLRRHRPAPKL